MKRWPAAVVLAAALGLLVAAAPGRWTERYFGVGSARDSVAACREARDHASGNLSDACVTRQGTRGESSFTDCICAHAVDDVYVCNVNLKVLCDGSLSSGGNQRPSQPGGEPKGRADRRLSPHSGAAGVRIDRPGLEVQ